MGFISSLFRKSTERITAAVQDDFSAIRTDIHSHLIPGIDDGVQSIEESIELLRGLQALGFNKAVTTPHVMSDCYRNTPSIILGGLDKVREAAATAGLSIGIEAAAEYYVDDAFVAKIEAKEKLLTIAGKYVLFEVSYINPPDNIFKVAFDLAMLGYTPLLAHPERYPFWYGKNDVYERLKDQGVKFQLNTNSLNGYYGPAAKKCAEFFVDQGMIDFIGSDMHGVRHLEGLKRTVNEKYFWKLAESGLLNREV
ncbi:MAG: tyrosine-protein phosphatase [Bacteroidota bacterium]